MNRERQRGAILIQVAIAMAVLCGFCALAIDYGVLQAARGQAQAAADAGALAGATALAYDTVFIPSYAEDAALAVASTFRVWDAVGQVTAVADGSSCSPPGVPPPPAVFRLLTCVTVDVYRDQARGNPLPTYFARAIGVQEQGTRARAIGTAVPANTTTCAWPVAVPDRWTDTDTGAWTTSPPSTFNPGDVYTAPTTAGPGSGFALSYSTLTANISLRLTPANFATPIGAGEFVPVRLPGGGAFAANLTSCHNDPVAIGDTLAVDATGTVGLVTTGATTRRGADIGASWNPTTLRIQNSCAGGSPPCAAMSPRLVALPVFNTAMYEATRLTGTPTIRVVNFVGFFINTVAPGVSVSGNLATYPGTVDLSKPQISYESAFLRAAVLYR